MVAANQALRVMVVVLVVGVMILSIVAALQEEEMQQMRSAAIERGYALYCPTDARFAWVGECG